MSPKTRSWVVTLALVALVGTGALVFNRLADAYTNAPHLASGQSAKLQGTDLSYTPAPTFALPDQTGAKFSLDALRGRPVVLTFIDTQCPHAECPLMAQYLNQTAQLLGAQTNNAMWLAISVNPTDTPATTERFLKGNNVSFPFHILLGNTATLTPLWSAYHIASYTGSDGIVIHSTGVYLIDQQGRERIFLDQGFDPKMLADDVRVLLAA
jgi:protein SCO1